MSSLPPTDQKPLRILMVLRAPLGGLYRHVIDLTEELSMRGHQIGLVMDSTISDLQTDQRIEALTHPPALGVHRIPIPRLLGFSDITAGLRIRALAKNYRVDVLHGHGAKGGFNARLASIGVKKQVAFYTSHGGVLHYDQKSMVGKLLRGIEKMLLPVTDGMIFESQFAKDAFETKIGPAPALAPVVYNGLAPSEFAPLDPNLATFDFSYVGELRTLKGVSYMLDALVNVIRADGTPATLIIGGGGPQEADLRAQITQLGLGERVKMMGVQPALGIFERGKNVVMPSLAESLPYVALEAAAASKPLIATNVGGVSEIFGPTKDALLPAKDSEALRHAMQNCLNAPEEAAREMETRLAWVKATFSINKMVDGIEKAYRQALEIA